METLNKMLSALLALVLVFGLLPMPVTAGATETEPQTQTLPEETAAVTEETTVPETAETVGDDAYTVPEETVPETTVVTVEKEAEPVMATSDQTKNEQYIQDMIDSGETQIFIDEAIVLANDFTIPADVMLVLRHGSITVPAGKTLINARGQINSWNSGSLIVEEGGTLLNQGYMNFSGVLDVRGTFEGNMVHTYHWVGGNNATITGIPDNQIWMHYVVGESSEKSNEEQFLENWALMESTNYGSYSQQIHGSMTLPGSITIPSNCVFVLEVSELTFTIPAGVTVTNKGTFYSYEKQTVQNNGVFENAGQAYIQGPWLGNAVVTAKMSQDDLEAAIAENAKKGWSYQLTNEVTLERDLIMENGQLFIGQGGKLIVPEGIKVQSNAFLMVNPGGILDCQGECTEVGVIYDNGSLGTVIGIPEENLYLHYYVYSEEEFDNDIQVAYDTNYAGDFLFVWENITLSKDTTIAANTIVHLYGGKTLTVPAGKTLTNEGGLCIWEGQTLLNNGTIDNYGFLDHWGTLTNNGTINIYSDPDLNGSLCVYEPGVVQNNGTVNVYGGITVNGTWNGNEPVQKRMTQDQLEAAMAQADYYNLTAEVTLERDMTIDKQFNIRPGGKLVVPENVKLTVKANIAVLGVLDIQGEYELVPAADGGHRSIGLYMIDKDFSAISGVAEKDMSLNCWSYNEEGLLYALKYINETNYGWDFVYVNQSMSLTGSNTVPANAMMDISKNVTLTIPTGSTLTVEGKLNIRNSAVVQNNGVVNMNGKLQNDGTWNGNEPVYPHTHSYTETVTAPTCTEKGYTTYTCDCGDSYTGNEVAALGHTEVIDKAVAATCTEPGKTEGKHCSVCNAVIVAQTEVAAKGHSFGDWYVSKEATTEAEGEERRDCANCDASETRAIPKVEIPTSGSCGVNLTWNYDKATGILTITGSGDMYNFTASVQMRSADPVVPWAAYQADIKQVILPEGLTGIGSNAFSGCENLTEITIPASVVTIGAGAFQSSGLTEITFQGDAPAEIGEGAFQNVSATVSYPKDNDTWTDDKMQNYGGEITWDNGASEDHGYAYGDANHDGRINAKDATLVLQKSVGTIREGQTFCERCADVTGDGKFNAKDSTMILRKSSGLLTAFPVEG